MNYSTIARVQSPTGASLAYRSLKASGPAKAVILINHGLSEHSGRYGGFAEALAARGYHVFAHDHRGHGHTTAPDAPTGQFARRDGADKVIEDVMAMRRLAVESHPDLPIILFGHSMGGLIAANTAEAHPDAFKGLAIWNANLNPGALDHVGKFLLKIERFFKGSDVPSTIAMKMTFEQWAASVKDAATPFDWLSHDPKAVAAYINDPLCGFYPSISMWIDVVGFAIRGGSKARLGRLPKSLPVHMKGGGQDPATEGGKAMRWLDGQLAGLGLQNRVLSILDEARHETLHEIGRQKSIDNFIDWCDRVCV